MFSPLYHSPMVEMGDLRAEARVRSVSTGCLLWTVRAACLLLPGLTLAGQAPVTAQAQGETFLLSNLTTPMDAV